MTGDCHVRIREGRRVKLPPATREARHYDVRHFAAALSAPSPRPPDGIRPGWRRPQSSFPHASPSSPVKGILLSSSSSDPPAPEGPGSVSGAPNLPAGFTGTFTSRYIDTGELRQHVVTGGEGPPLLLVHGWPQTWYAWRLVMPALARDFSVIA